MDDEEEEVIFTPLSLRQAQNSKVILEKELPKGKVLSTITPQVLSSQSQGPDAKAKGPVHVEKKVEKNGHCNGGEAPVEKSKTPSRAERRVEARRPGANTNDKSSVRPGTESRRGSSAANLREREDAARSKREAAGPPERRKTSPTVTRAASATGRLPGQTGGVRRSKSQEVERNHPVTGRTPVEVDACDMRSLEAQMASFRTRTAALEGEVAQLRAESQGQDEEIRRLRQELQSKEAELQQKDFEVKRLQISAAEQNKTLQSFLRNSFNVAPPVGGSLTLPPGVPALPLGCPSPQRCTTPRVVPTAPAPVPVTMATVPAHMQVYSPSPAVQLRAVGGGETPVLRTPTLTHRAVPVLPVRLTPRQVWYSPSQTTR